MSRLPAFFLSLLIGVTLIIAGVFALSQQGVWQLRDRPNWDFTPAQLEALSDISPLSIEIYHRPNPNLKREFQRWLYPLALYLPNLEIRYINPDTHPTLVQQRGITRDAQLVVEVGKTYHRLDTPSPTKLYQLLSNLGDKPRRTIIHLQGHGERAFLSDTAGTWQSLYRQLQNSGHIIQALSSENSHIMPHNTELLIIADPNKDSLNGEYPLLRDYVAQGGNLLYTTDTQQAYLPDFIREISGLDTLSGIIVGLDAQQHGLNDPTFILADGIGTHSMLAALNQSPLIPTTVGFIEKTEPAPGWSRQVLLYSSANSWNETGEMTGTIRHDADEQRGPIALVWLLTREIKGKTQSIIVAGDSDMWTSPYREIGGNALWFDIVFNYLLDMPAAQMPSALPSLPDQVIEIDSNTLLRLALLAILVLPLLVLGLALVYYRIVRCRYRLD